MKINFPSTCKVEYQERWSHYEINVSNDIVAPLIAVLKRQDWVRTALSIWDGEISLYVNPAFELTPVQVKDAVMRLYVYVTEGKE